MGRCQSTPGLVESKERTTVEEMWISPMPMPSAAPSFVTQHTWVVILFFILLTRKFNEFVVFLLLLLLVVLIFFTFVPLAICNTARNHIDVIVQRTLNERELLIHRALWVHLYIALMNVHVVELHHIRMHHVLNRSPVEMVNSRLDYVHI